jgi:phytoene dehydrogenase-like protein
MLDADVLVIGSGAGGLVAGLALARAGRRVHVVEQHYVPGGFCHSFTLEGFRFSPGVHYIGELGPGGLTRRVLEGLGVGGDIEFFELNRDGYDHVDTDGERFDFPAPREALAERLAERFPSQARGVRAYLALVERIGREMSALSLTDRWRDMFTLPVRAPVSLRHGALPTARVLARFVDDPRCRSLLATQCGDHGLPPSRAPFILHGPVAAHYLDGGFHPRGGGAALVKALTRGLKQAHGTFEVRRRVEKILVEPSGRGLRVVGARFVDGTELRADTVVSNADPVVTYQLVGPEHLSWRLRRRLVTTRWSVSALSLFLAVDTDLRAAGLDSGNYWLRNVTDPEAFFVSARDLDGDGPLPLFVSVSTLKDPTHFDGRHHVIEAFAFVDYAPFARWAGERVDDRSEAYEQFKARLERRMLAKLETLVPGLSSRVVFKSLGTPLTNVHYVAATRGAVYGTEKLLFQLGPLGFPSQTEIDGLFLCGASTFSMGVIGAMLSGLRCAARMLRCTTGEILDARGTPLTTYPAEDPSRWPADVVAKVSGRASRAHAREAAAHSLS